jgi:hypothetical protein
VHGIAMWFDATLAADVQLSSSPWSPTHWRQCFAPLLQPMSLTAGETVEVALDTKLRQSLADTFRFELSMQRLG